MRNLKTVKGQQRAKGWQGSTRGADNTVLFPHLETSQHSTQEMEVRHIALITVM